MEATAQTKWRIRGDEVGSCNCAWGCPCQFNALPTQGNCEAVIGFQVRDGQFGDTQLDGVRWAAIVHWPGAIHEGNGTIQLVLDEASTAEQRDAIVSMSSGEHGGAYFEIFASVIPNVREPITASIDIEVDRDSRQASVRIDGVGESRIEPIKNPVTGDEHRVRIVIPDGFEYQEAEVANTVSATTTVDAPLSLKLENSYAQLNEFDWSNA
ncbi:MAG: DUF1326 domain-containing protein [Thermoleophilaceae bacterium]